MKTVVFVLQKSQFSAVIGNERCRFHDEESMSLSDSKPEKIVEFFENNDDFKGWDDTKLFILYDSESAKYLFNIIDGFELKNKVDQCKNFSFQIKLEEKPIDLNGNIAAILEKGDSAAASEIGKLKNEIDDLKKEIEDKNSKNENLNRNIAEKDSEINSLKEGIKNLKDEIAPKDKKIEELQKWSDDWDCYAAANIKKNDRILELKKPIGDIHKIYFFSTTSIPYYEVEKQLKNMKDEGSKWRFPTKNECGILKKLFWIHQYTNWYSSNRSSKFFPFSSWLVKDGYIYQADNSEYEREDTFYDCNKSEYNSAYVLFVC